MACRYLRGIPPCSRYMFAALWQSTHSSHGQRHLHLPHLHACRPGHQHPSIPHQSHLSRLSSSAWFCSASARERMHSCRPALLAASRSCAWGAKGWAGVRAQELEVQTALQIAMRKAQCTQSRLNPPAADIVPSCEPIPGQTHQSPPHFRRDVGSEAGHALGMRSSKRAASNR